MATPASICLSFLFFDRVPSDFQQRATWERLSSSQCPIVGGSTFRDNGILILTTDAPLELQILIGAHNSGASTTPSSRAFAGR